MSSTSAGGRATCSLKWLGSRGFSPSPPSSLSGPLSEATNCGDRKSEERDGSFVRDALPILRFELSGAEAWDAAGRGLVSSWLIERGSFTNEPSGDREVAFAATGFRLEQLAPLDIFCDLGDAARPEVELQELR